MTKQVTTIERKNIAIIGKTNAGKSTLFNALTEQDNAIVSPIAGTTTDPVAKAAELLPFGPVVLIDTAGSEDTSALGAQRAKKTQATMRRADMTLYVADGKSFDEEAYNEFAKENLPHILVLNMCQATQLKELKEKYPQAVLLTDMNEVELEVLRKEIADLLTSLDPEDIPVMARLLSAGDTAVMVIPIDTEAPKGRIILPQVQMIRQCLDAGVRSVVVRPTELKAAIAEQHVDIVVTDSQAFAEVAQMVPDDIALTSFSMLLAYNSSNYEQLLKGCNAVKDLPDGAKILMLEGCTHNRSHEDIGRYKIPALLKKQTEKEFSFTFYSGYDFPENVANYDMAIQCGNCMLNSREGASRLSILAQNEIPVTNYGILLAYLNGILERAAQIFIKEV